MFAKTRTENPTAGWGSNVETSEGVITVSVPPRRGCSCAPTPPTATSTHARLAASTSIVRATRRVIAPSRLEITDPPGAPRRSFASTGDRSAAPQPRPLASACGPDERLLVRKSRGVLVFQYELRRASGVLVVGPAKHQDRAPRREAEASRDLAPGLDGHDHLMSPDQPDAGLALDPLGDGQLRRPIEIETQGDLARQIDPPVAKGAPADGAQGPVAVHLA